MMRSSRLTDLRTGLAVGLIALMALAGCLRGTDLLATGAKDAAPGAPEQISVTALPPPPDAASDPNAASDNTQTLTNGSANATTPGGVENSAPGNVEDTAKAAAPPSSAPQSEPVRAPLPVPTTVFGRKVQQDLQNACTQSGGTFGPRGKSGALACFTTPPDAGKACTRKSDCIGQCLARSRTCSPVIPLVGCNEVLLESGARVTECLE